MTAVEMVKVESSNIDSVGHDAATMTLRVKFKNGGFYEYGMVPESLFRALLETKSKGKFVHDVLVAQPKDYPAKKIDEAG